MFRFAKMILFETGEAIKKFEVSRISAFANMTVILEVSQYSAIIGAHNNGCNAPGQGDYPLAYLPKCPYNSLAEAIWANPVKIRISELRGN